MLTDFLALTVQLYNDLVYSNIYANDPRLDELGKQLEEAKALLRKARNKPPKTFTPI